MYARIPEKALRSYINDPSSRTSSSTLQAFLDLIMGINDTISAENEAMVRDALRSMCTSRLQNVEDDMAALAAQQYPNSGQPVADAKRMVEQLWVNDCEILKGVVRSLDDNIIF